MNTKNEPVHIGGRKKVNPTKVILLKADEMYTLLYMEDGKKHLVATTLKTLELRFFPHNFCRTNRSFLVNPSFVSGINDAHLLMSNNVEIIISRRKRENVLKQLNFL